MILNLPWRTPTEYIHTEANVEMVPAYVAKLAEKFRDSRWFHYITIKFSETNTKDKTDKSQLNHLFTR